MNRDAHGAWVNPRPLRLLEWPGHTRPSDGRIDRALMRTLTRRIRVKRRCPGTMALKYGRPVFLFQTTVVARWLVMPRAAKSEAASPSLIIVVWITERVRSQISTGLAQPSQPAAGSAHAQAD